MPTLAPKLPWQHAFAGGYPRRGGQPLPTDPDAIDYLNRVAAADGGAAVEVGIAQAIDAFVRGCKADSAGFAGDPTRTNWDAIQASCIMCGARTLSGALVPLKTPYGPELVNIDALPTPTIADSGGSAGEWTAATRTMSNTPVGSSDTYPRFTFAVSATVGRRYRVSGVLSGDIADVYWVRLGASGVGVVPNPVTGAFDFVAVCPAASIQFLLNGTLAPSSVRIESLSIREDSFTPTAFGSWASGDYSRSGSTPGLKGNGSTKYLNTNRANNADGQNDSHFSAFVTLPTTLFNSYYLGAFTASAVKYLNSRYPTDFYLRDGAVEYVAAGKANATGLMGMSRDNAANVKFRIDGVGGTHTSASWVGDSYSTFIFARNATGTAANFSDGRLAFYSIGAAIDLAAMDERVTNLVTAIRFHTLTGLLPNDYDPATIAYITAAYAAGGTL